MKRTIIILILAVLILTVVLPAFAAEPECPVCGGADWTGVTAADWAEGGAVTSGHYRLTEDIDLTAALTVAAGETVCLDLAGFSLVQTATSTEKSYTLRVLENSGTLTVLDSVGGGVITGGRCYAGESNNNTNGGNIYCGADSVFNLCGGTVTGGTVRRKYHSANRFTGGNLFSKGTVNIYGGVIADGYVYSDYVSGVNTTGLRQICVAGGNVSVSGGALNISGGVITGGRVENLTKAPSAPGTFEALGGNIYANNTALTVTGGEITGGSVLCENQAADSASGTELTATACGGNIWFGGQEEMTVTGGVISGGSTAASAEAYPDKTLTSAVFYSQGGNLYTGENTLLQYEDGVNAEGTAYQGGNMYTTGIVHIHGGEFYGGKAVATGEKTENYGGLIYGSRKTYIYGGEFYGGEAARGGNLYAGDCLTVAGGVIRDGVATNRGGNIGTLNGYLILKGGVITGGSGNRLYGSNIWCAHLLYMYGGQVTDPASGSSITVMSGASAYIYDGVITGGLYGYDSATIDCGNLYIYGGDMDYIRTGTAGTNNIEIIAGRIGGFVNGSSVEMTLEELDANENGNPVVRDCTHISRENGYTFWHHFTGTCEACEHTFGAESCQRCKWVHTGMTGSHSFENGSCAVCNFKEDGSQQAILGDTYYDTLEEALSRGEATGETVKLVRDVTLEDLSLYSKLDLNGYLLTVTGVLGAENKKAGILDSVGTGGIVGKLYLHPDNAWLPVLEDGVRRFEQVTLEQKIETLSQDRIRLEFVIKDPADQTRLDTGADYKVCIRVTWQEQGKEKFHLFTYNTEMVESYVSAWGERMFTCDITGLSLLESWTVTAQVISGQAVAAAEDVTPSQTTSVSRYESGGGYTVASNMPTWEAINALPQKYSGMTATEARQAVVAFMDFVKTFTWVPDTDKTYWVSEGMGYHALEGNSRYGGLPYVTLGTGNIYRFMDYMDPETGVVDIQKAMEAPVLFGNQCSISVYYAYSRVVNSNHTSAYTADLNYKNGYIPVGPYTYTLEESRFTETGCDTDDVCRENGEAVMYRSYINTLPGDGLVSPGHAILCTGAAEVAYDENGDIIPERSYLTISDQTSGWGFAMDRFSETYQYVRTTRERWTFKKLYEKGYIPFTFAEYQGTDPIEETEVTCTHTGDTITKAQLEGTEISANYGVSDIYAVITDSQGNEVYKLAVRNRSSLARKLTFGFEIIKSGVDTCVQWGDIDGLSPEEEYRMELIAQLTTGERPTVWEGVYLLE